MATGTKLFLSEQKKIQKSKWTKTNPEQFALWTGRRFPVVGTGRQQAAEGAPLLAPFIQHRQRHEERHLQDEQHQDAAHGVDAEGAQRRHALYRRK